MSEKIVQLNEEIIKGQIRIGPWQRGGNPERAAGKEAESLTQAGRL